MRVSSLFRRSGWLLLASLAALPAESAAQHAPTPGSPESRRPAAPPPSSDSARSLRDSFGIDAARGLLGVDDERAIERLGALGTDAALQELVRLSENAGGLGAREVMLLAEALSHRATEPRAVRALYALVARGTGEPTRPRGKLDSMARERAALALSLGGTAEGLGLLARMVKRGSEDGELAVRALVAHPPRDLRPVLDSPGLPNPTFAALLERLGDQRAFVALREMVRRGSEDVKARAALALTRLGHLETVPLAKAWLAGSRFAAQRRAATEILMQVGDPDAAAAWKGLAAEDAALAFDLALAHPLPSLLGPLRELLDERAEPRWLTLLGHLGSDAAVELLAKHFAPPHESTVAYALARSTSEAAPEALREATASEAPEVRRLATMGLVVRRVLFGHGPVPSSELTRALVESKRREDRWAGAWARAALDPDLAVAQLDSESALLLSATVATALVQPRRFLEACRERLLREQDPARRQLLGLALTSGPVRDEVPTHWLLQWIDTGSPLGPLAIRALAERDDERFAPRIDVALASTQVAIRAAAALGLARNPRPEFSGRLASAYRFETEGDVRLALVVAASSRPESPSKQAMLRTASALDADPRVRHAARLALMGQRLASDPRGGEVLWVEMPRGPVADWVTSWSAPGPEVPIPSAGQRILPILGVQGSEGRVRLAPSQKARDDGPRDAPEPKGS